MKIFGFWGWRVPPFPTPLRGAPPTHHPFLSCAQRDNENRCPKISGVMNTPEAHPPTHFGCFLKTTLRKRTIKKYFYCCRLRTVVGGAPPHPRFAWWALGASALSPKPTKRLGGCRCHLCGESVHLPSALPGGASFLLKPLHAAYCKRGLRAVAGGVPPRPPRPQAPPFIMLFFLFCVYGVGRSTPLVSLRAGRFHPPCVQVLFCGFLRNRR